MGNTIFLLDFREGTVQEIDEATPPRGIRDPEGRSAPESLPQYEGFALAALGSPPERDAE